MTTGETETGERQPVPSRLPRELYERLRREAFNTRISQNAIITEALARELDRREAARREAEAQGAPAK